MNHHRLILASGSKARQQMLINAGLVFDSIPADIDEDSIKQELSDPEEISLKLAEDKALKVSQDNPEAYVIGSDQILVMDNIIFSKAKNKDEACSRLLELKGKTHTLISSCAVCVNNKIVWHETQKAHLSMHDFDEDFLENYLLNAGDAITNSVGSYAFEGLGAWLFNKVDGDYFTILGMPLLPLLQFLNSEGFKPCQQR